MIFIMTGKKIKRIYQKGYDAGLQKGFELARFYLTGQTGHWTIPAETLSSNSTLPKPKAPIPDVFLQAFSNEGEK